jgi:hypothetical protein
MCGLTLIWIYGGILRFSREGSQLKMIRKEWGKSCEKIMLEQRDETMIRLKVIGL